jgi:hypothetical protein
VGLQACRDVGGEVRGTKHAEDREDIMGFKGEYNYTQ